MKSFDVKNTESFLRNTFYTVGKYDMPMIYKQEIDTNDISLIGFHNTKSKDNRNKNKTVHFFLDDYKFNCVWNSPMRSKEKLSQYRYIFTPDFSLYTNMPMSIQIYNTFRRRWCGAFWQANDLTVIPSVTWGDERSFDFCFDGIEQGSTVAVSTIGSRKCEESYLKGFTAMCNQLKPEKVLCYYKPFDKMLDLVNVITLPYEGIEVRKKKHTLNREIS